MKPFGVVIVDVQRERIEVARGWKWQGKELGWCMIFCHFTEHLIY
jgi:hypothetical protein